MASFVDLPRWRTPRIVSSSAVRPFQRVVLALHRESTPPCAAISALRVNTFNDGGQSMITKSNAESTSSSRDLKPRRAIRGREEGDFSRGEVAVGRYQLELGRAATRDLAERRILGEPFQRARIQGVLVDAGSPSWRCPCGSRSTRRVRNPAEPNAAARLTLVVVFADPRPSGWLWQSAVPIAIPSLYGAIIHAPVANRHGGPALGSIAA